MTRTKRLGIIICDRYRSCAAGKCLRAMRRREGAFETYRDCEVELVGLTSCGGCPGGNIEYAPAELLKNGAEVIHLATGMVVGYPPCPRITFFKRYIESRFGLPVVVGTHPVPESYYLAHDQLGTWLAPRWEDLLEPNLCDETVRSAYD